MYLFKSDWVFTEIFCVFFYSGAIENGVETTKKKTFVPHNREDLLNKIESLKLADDDGDDDYSFDDSDVGSDFEGSEFNDDDDEE